MIKKQTIKLEVETCKANIARMAKASLPTEFGDFMAVAYLNKIDGKEHLALVKGDVEGKSNILVRVHSSCLTGDALYSLKCDCGDQLAFAMQKVQQEGLGAIIYLNQEGRGIGLANKIKAYSLQDLGHDTVEANEKLGLKPDLRDYHAAARIIDDLGISSIKLLTNNPNKIGDLIKCGVKVAQRVPIIIKPNKHNKDYINVKKTKMGHLIADSD